MGGGASVNKKDSDKTRSKGEVLVVEDVTVEPTDAESIRSIPLSNKELSIRRGIMVNENPAAVYVGQGYQSRNSQRSVMQCQHRPSQVSSRSSRTNLNDSFFTSCPHCGHRRRIGVPPLSPGSQPPWILREPVTGLQSFDMDEYDIEAMMKKVTDEYGHLPRCYDHVPVVKIVHSRKKLFSDDDDFQLYTHPMVARKHPAISPLRTPLPEIQDYQKFDNSRSKPFSDELLND